ncbi:MAG: SH3 domain-containing protein [Spirochaetales bacterium]|nr:SH3 domain-containing protein [Spirochaetales bacterium]
METKQCESGGKRKNPTAVGVCLCIIYSLAFLSCSKKTPPLKVELPPTPVLTVQSNWGVVTSPYLRVRKKPASDGEVVAHLRNASVTEVLSRTPYQETVEGKTDYWYEIAVEGLRGWVFGSYLKFFDSKAEAEKAAGISQNG